MEAMGSRPSDYFSAVEDVSGILNSADSGELLTIKELCALRRTIMAARGLSEKLEDLASMGDCKERYWLKLPLSLSYYFMFSGFEFLV